MIDVAVVLDFLRLPTSTGVPNRDQVNRLHHGTEILHNKDI